MHERRAILPCRLVASALAWATRRVKLLPLSTVSRRAPNGTAQFLVLSPARVILRLSRTRKWDPLPRLPGSSLGGGFRAGASSVHAPRGPGVSTRPLAPEHRHSYEIRNSSKLRETPLLTGGEGIGGKARPPKRRPRTASTPSTPCPGAAPSAILCPPRLPAPAPPSRCRSASGRAPAASLIIRPTAGASRKRPRP